MAEVQRNDSARENGERTEATAEERQTFHEDALAEFNTRFNYFLVFESLLLGGTLTLLDSDIRPSDLRIISSIGALATVLWGLIQLRTAKIVRGIRDKLGTEPIRREVAEIKEGLPRYLQASNTVVMSVYLPTVVLLAWIAIWVRA